MASTRKTLELQSKVDPPRFYLLVLGYALQGETEKAFYWIGQAFENRVGWIPFVGTDPGLDGLRADPRFHALLRRLGVQGQVAPVS